MPAETQAISEITDLDKKNNQDMWFIHLSWSLISLHWVKSHYFQQVLHQ